MSEESRMIAAKLLQAINASQYTYVEISKKCGVPKSAIQRYATGKTESIPFDRLKAICSVIGIDVKEIMGWSDKDSSKSSDDVLLESRIRRLMAYYNKLNDIGKNYIDETLDNAINLDKYTKPTDSDHK